MMASEDGSEKGLLELADIQWLRSPSWAWRASLLVFRFSGVDSG